MKKRILSILFLYSCFSLFCQNNESIFPNLIGKNLNTIKNNDEWKILKKSTGDLNKDGFNDFALILESKDSILEKRCSGCYLVKNKPRIIVILLKQNKSEKVIIQNNKFIARGNEGGMLPYLEPDLSIENGLLNIEYQYTRSNQSYIFELKDNQMIIVKAEGNGIHAASGDFESNKFDFKKGKLIEKKGNISVEKEEIKIIKFNIKPKTLSEFEEMYEWEIIEYKNL